MNAPYLHRLSPEKRQKQIERAAFHAVVSSHRNGKGSPFSKENQRVISRVQYGLNHL